MYQNFISRHFSNQSGIIILVNWPRAYCGVLQLNEVSSLGPDSPRTSSRNETVKQCRRQMTVANSPVQWPSWTRWNYSWHNIRVTLNQRWFALIRPHTRLLYWYHDISLTQSHSCRASLFDSWATSVLGGWDMDRTGGTDWRKNKVYIREYSPKTMSIVGVRTALQC